MKRLEDDELCACGISRWWATRLDDPFIEACAWHDAAYVVGSWAQSHMTREQVDRAFLAQMLTIAGTNRYLRFRARLFYSIVRALGAAAWEGTYKPKKLSARKTTLRRLWDSFCDLEAKFAKRQMLTT